MHALTKIVRLSTILLLLGGATLWSSDGPLPKFTFKEVVLKAEDLKFAPTGELERAGLIKMEGLIPNPLGKYYLYYSPHKHVGIGLVYSDSIEGPWKEYEGNPLIEATAIPDVRWFESTGKFHLWGHRKNSQTEMWTSPDGLNFDYHSVSVAAKNIGTKNATYTRAYEYPLKRHGSRFIMLYSGYFVDQKIRCIWLAHSQDGESWTQEKTPLVIPIEGENNDLYGPSLFRWKGRNYVVYQDHTGNRGGLVKYVKLDDQLNAVGKGGKRHILIDHDPNSPADNRYRGCEFYREGDKIYMFAGVANHPRVLAYAVAEVGDVKSESPRPVVKVASPAKQQSEKTKPQKKTKTKRKPKATPAKATSLDEVLKDAKLETVYETTFDEPLRLIREADLTDGGKEYVREPGEDVDWVLEGPGEVTVKNGRMHFKNSPQGNAVVWNTREFPDSFLAEWDFEHHHAQGTVIIFFAARGEQGGSIYTPGLPQRTGNFGNYTKGKIHTYHTSYSATDEQGVPRGSTHLKKDIKDDTLGAGGKIGAGPGAIDGVTGKAHRLRLAKLGNRIILEINGVVSFDCIDDGEKGGPPFKSGQIGFRQMRHTIEGSYGGLKVQRVILPGTKRQTTASAVKERTRSKATKPVSPHPKTERTRPTTSPKQKTAKTDDTYPPVDELPVLKKLPDPFRFFQSDRRVANLQDWKQRQDEIRRLDVHYSAGPAFPQTHNLTIENIEATKVYGGKATHFKATGVVGPNDAIKCRFEYVLPKAEGPTPLIFYICPRKDFADECLPWQEKIVERGYAFAWAIPGQFNGYGDEGPVKDAFPKVKGNTMMAWIWGINELLHHLDTKHEFDKIIITGTSRFGKTATAAGIVNENIDLTVPVTGGFAVELFNLTNNKMSAEQMAKKCYANEVMTTFAGQLERLPIDQHFRGALIAPRAYLGIMGAENDKKNRSHIEAYEALVPVYEWLGIKHKLGLYDHSPHGHGICEDDFHTIMDFADQIFYGKQPKSGKVFDQISNPDLIGFDWKAPN